VAAAVLANLQLLQLVETKLKDILQDLTAPVQEMHFFTVEPEVDSQDLEILAVAVEETKHLNSLQITAVGAVLVLL
jgi:hypothetical protein